MSYRQTPEEAAAVRAFEEIHMKPRWPYREIISAGGGEGCEIIIRRTLLKRRGFKLLLHHFLPHSRDVDPHDHPSSFLTVVLWGRYTDVSPEGSEVLKAPCVRFRPAEHQHTTMTDHRGAWTLVLMAPKSRAWGFIRDNRWMPWHEYVEEFGEGINCD